MAKERDTLKPLSRPPPHVRTTAELQTSWATLSPTGDSTTNKRNLRDGSHGPERGESLLCPESSRESGQPPPSSPILGDIGPYGQHQITNGSDPPWRMGRTLVTLQYGWPAFHVKGGRPFATCVFCHPDLWAAAFSGKRRPSICYMCYTAPVGKLFRCPGRPPAPPLDSSKVCL